MLHEKKGTDSPFEMTKDSQPANNSSSNQHSANVQNMTKLLQSHLINSFNEQLKSIQDQKTKIYKEKDLQDTILDLNKYFDHAELDFTDAEQQ